MCTTSLEQPLTPWLQNTARWNTTGLGSAEDGAPPALDGGIEYFIRPTLCQGIQGEALRGRAGRSLTCQDLEAAVARGLESWSHRHASLYFRRVYNESKAELLIGSETHGRRHSQKQDTIAYAQIGLHSSAAGVISPVGKPVPGYAISHARIKFNPDHCFYLRVSSLCLDDKPNLRFYLWYLNAIAVFVLGAGSFFLRAYGAIGRYKSEKQTKAIAVARKCFLILLVRGILSTLTTGILEAECQLQAWVALNVFWIGMCGASLSCFSFETILRQLNPSFVGIHN